mgnify:CR=1 FL=1
MAMSRETFGWEKNMQPYMDVWYFKNGDLPDRTRACIEYDVILGNKRIEEKFLFSGKEYSVMLVEIVQNLTAWDWGWFKHSRADILAWCYCPSNHTGKPICVYWINFTLLRAHVWEMLGRPDQWLKFQVCTQHYGITINLPVDLKVLVDKKIATRYVL